MPGMKFQVVSRQHSEEIQRALFRIGYKWAGRGETTPIETSAPYLFAAEDNGHKLISYGHSKQHFDYHHYTEYVYRLAMVEPRNDRPLLPEKVEDLHAHVADEIILDASHPIGVAPRDIADRLYAIGRANELAEAITRFTNASKEVPIVWVEEYNERVNKIRKLENIA